MKGNPNLIETLNTLLADELTAISQYMVHSGMSENWGYSKLHDHFEKRAIEEMKHAERLIGRVLVSVKERWKMERLQRRSLRRSHASGGMLPTSSRLPGV